MQGCLWPTLFSPDILKMQRLVLPVQPAPPYQKYSWIPGNDWRVLSLLSTCCCLVGYGGIFGDLIVWFYLILFFSPYLECLPEKLIYFFSVVWLVFVFVFLLPLVSLCWFPPIQREWHHCFFLVVLNSVNCCCGLLL